MIMDLSMLAISLLLLFAQSTEATIYDVTKYGGKGDVAQGFTAAWKVACQASTSSVILIPQGTYYMNVVHVRGPCKAPIEIRLVGNVQAPKDYKQMIDPTDNTEAEGWLTFTDVDSLTITGGGTMDGLGEMAWKDNECKVKKYCKMFPINLRFFGVSNSIVHHITSKDSKGFHANVINCKSLTFEHFTISAPETSLNTDGIHVGRSTDIKILNSDIKTGDDCISVGDNMQQLHVENVNCGPGHGFSIGSLGFYDDEKDVVGVYFKGCTLTNTMFGVRIKSWPNNPPNYNGLLSDVHFEDITMSNVSTPVLIDQTYCPHNLCSKDQNSKLQISNVHIKNVRGTSATPESVTLLCSNAKPCQNVEISDIDLKLHQGGGQTTSSCKNIQPTLGGKLSPAICATKAQSA